MGDRGNIVIRQGKNTNMDDVWFYTHWSGCEIKDTVRKALSKEERWDDRAYLARIVFCELVKDDAGGLTGFGISTKIGDNEYDILVVDVPGQRVFEIGEDELMDGRVPAGFEPPQSWPFKEFIRNGTGATP